MKKAELITSTNAAHDARIRNIRLTKKARALIEELAPVWMKMAEAGDHLNQEAGDVIALLDRLDEALKQKSLLERILDAT